jgi:sulfite reductase alpha subunit-like flavoprotein
LTSKCCALSQTTTDYEEWKHTQYPNLAEILQEFSSIKLPASFLLTQLPLLQQRFYSISSSPALHPGQVQTTIAVVKYITQGKKKVY